VESLFRNHRKFPHLDLAGIHLHIGSQILKASPFAAAIRKAIALAKKARRWGVTVRYLNIGGGLGIVYHRETPQTAQAFASRILPLLKNSSLKLILEPGRFIAGNSGILLTRVVTLKENGRKRFAVVDAGMNDLIRPSLYGAYHEMVLSGGAARRGRLRYDVVGPVCESGDFFAKDRLLPRLARGDLLAILGAGAYGFAMSSNYNARPRAAEVMVRGRRWFVIRRRETFEDLVRGERLPPFLR
jgi:diaminopimelate decarboxylase